jgi:hypothetical protein
MPLNNFSLDTYELMYSSLSDIVRDFTLASRTNVELQHLQQSFISTIISSIAAKSGNSQRHEAVYTYAINSLAYHVRAALSPPYEPDDLAASLLLHSDSSIASQVWCWICLRLFSTGQVL